MSRFRLRPTVVEAERFELSGPTPLAAVMRLTALLGDTRHVVMEPNNDPEALVIEVPARMIVMRPGDWVVIDPCGGVHVLAAHTFNALVEPEKEPHHDDQA